MEMNVFKFTKQTFFSFQSVPVKRKKGECKSTENVNKAKKSKDMVVSAAGGDDSDSDSSLDVEKWKKRVLQMTG